MTTNATITHPIAALSRTLFSHIMLEASGSKRQGPEIIKLFVLNSAEHEICPANKSQITNNCKFFLVKHN